MRRSAPPPRAPGALRSGRRPLQRLDLRLALAVEASLLDKPGAKLAEGAEQHVDLVERVLDVELGVELELEADPLRAVRDLENDARCGLTSLLLSWPKRSRLVISRSEVSST
jgi:hypothetical protein